MRIETDEFVLRAWQICDAERLAVMADNKKIYDNLRDSFPHPYSIEDAKRFIETVQKDNALTKYLAIEINGQLMGSIGALMQADIYRQNAEIGYFLAEECWGKGIMTKVIRVFTGYIFDHFPITRIYADPFARNHGSRRALEKAGFRLEAVLKANVIKNGVIEDSCIYAMLKEDRAEIKRTSMVGDQH